ncbi:hypothetical protein AZE42_11886, partial [Rhizopogon vesiculosus]
VLPSFFSTHVPTLNVLLVALSLQFELASPTDMTPLLLAVLESIFEFSPPYTSVFLGVLECDVLPPDEDIGLADIDPRKETGKKPYSLCLETLICDPILPHWDWWLRANTNCKLGGSARSEAHHRHPCVASPSTRSTATMSAQTDLYMHDASPVESDMSIAYSELSDGTETQPIRNNTVHHQPQCIHELEDPSYFLERDTWYTSSADDSIEEFYLDRSTQSTFSAKQPLTPIGGYAALELGVTLVLCMKFYISEHKYFAKQIDNLVGESSLDRVTLMASIYRALVTFMTIHLQDFRDIPFFEDRTKVSFHHLHASLVSRRIDPFLRDTLKVSEMQVSPVKIETIVLAHPDKLITDVAIAGVIGGAHSACTVGAALGGEEVVTRLDEYIPNSPAGKVLRCVSVEEYEREVSANVSLKL